MPNFHPPRLGPPPHPTSSSFSTSPSLSSFGGGSIATVSSSVPPPVQSPAPDSSEGVGSAETETAASGQHRGESGGSRSNTVDAGDKKVSEDVDIEQHEQNEFRYCEVVIFKGTE